MERLDATKPADAQDLFESIRETRAKINEIIEERDIMVEKYAKMEGDHDKMKKELDTTRKALMQSIEEVAHHTHDASGRACAPLVR